VRHQLVQRIVRAYETHTRAEQLPLGIDGAEMAPPPVGAARVKPTLKQ
jgi:phosphate starvation-inducible protein PhoH and related proteins